MRLQHPARGPRPLTEQQKAEEPAFGHGDHTHGGAPGLSKRELIAAMALQGVLANDAWTASEAAELAVEAAEALLEALTPSEGLKP